MKLTLKLLTLALMTALLVVPVMAQEDEQAATATSTEVAGSDDELDDEWLNTVWTQVDDMVKEEEHKLQETVTVAGVRGAEAEDSILDRLYYKGAKRYPSQDKLNKAIETLREALAAAPRGENAPMQKYFIAQCYEKLGRTSDARTYYGHVTKDHPNTTWSKKAQADLDRLTTQ
ncbi:MAG: tetratricopeptide repeat protein [Candidatus Latescibacterota bacterium]|nr:tetratricopeptide repeat protein [Candidatus Latescibacterota bacterium]MEE3040360.1 tetratricopeptide repeat protein [Candidatus Latescibacterota bacterium]